VAFDLCFLFHQVDDPDGHKVQEVKGESEGMVYITAEKEGDYKICFTARDKTEAQDITLWIDWRVGALAQDWEVIAKKEHLDHIGVELRKFEEVVKEIHREMRAIRKRDLENQTVKASAHSRVEFFTMFTMFMCAAMATMQYFYLKRFFKSKKVL